MRVPWPENARQVWLNFDKRKAQVKSNPPTKTVPLRRARDIAGNETGLLRDFTMPRGTLS